MKFPGCFACLGALAVLMTSAALGADPGELGAIKTRMEQRVPLLNALKAKGEVGEDSHGFAVLRGGDVDAGDAVAAENHDRRIVYVEGAKEAHTTAERVGRVWARKLAAESPRGVWLQRDDGEWYRK